MFYDGKYALLSYIGT